MTRMRGEVRESRQLESGGEQVCRLRSALSTVDTGHMPSLQPDWQGLPQHLVTTTRVISAASGHRRSGPLGAVVPDAGQSSIKCFIVCLLGLGDPSDFCRPL